MTRQSGGLQLASLTSVWPSLTPNAKRVIDLLIFASVVEMLVSKLFLHEFMITGVPCDCEIPIGQYRIWSGRLHWA